MKVILDLDELLRERRITAAEAERLRGLPQSGSSPTAGVRSLWWLLVPAMIGLIGGEVAGALLADVWGGGELLGPYGVVLWGLLRGGFIGLIIGGGVGAFLWLQATSPGTGGNKQRTEPASYDMKCPHCGGKVNPLTREGLHSPEAEPWLLLCNQCQAKIEPML